MRPDRSGGDPISTPDFSLTGSELRTFVRTGVDGVASLVRTTYGPRGRDSLVELNGSKNEVVVELTSSGRGVLDAIERGDGFQHPVAAVIVDAVDTMHRDLNDGSTTVVLLLQALLERGYELIEQGLSPTDVLVGYALAADEVGRVFDDLARPVSYADTETLGQVARTTMTPRLAGDPDEAYVRLVVEAVQGLAAESEGAWVDTTQVKLLADPATETKLHDGVVVTRWPRGAEKSDRSLVDFDWASQFPEPLEDVSVAILDAEIDVEKSGTNFGMGSDPGVRLDSVGSVERYHSGLIARKRALVEHIADLGVDILVSQARVDDDLIRLFEDADVAVVDRVETPEADVDRLAVATGATVVSRPEDVSVDRLGTVGRLFERRTGEEKWTYFTDCAGAAYTLTLRVPVEQGAAHHRRVVEDALDVTATAVMDGQVLPGAGAAGMTAGAALRREALSIGGREALAVSAFGAALEDTVRVLAHNAGLDPIDVIAGLRNARAGGDCAGEAVGIDVVAGEQADAWAAGIVEPRRVFSQALETARTLASQFLTTDAFLYPNTSLSGFTPNTEHH
jgi:chaperonin GroEL (HSP60 family)